MCYFKQKKNNEATACLKDISEISPNNISEQELKDIAAVKLGHFAFDDEPPRLVDAAKYYASVPSTSTKYDEALLGLAWAFLKNKRFDKAERAVDELISVAPNSFLVGEAYLLKGYCQFFDKKYDQAMKSFDKAVEMSNAQAVSESDVQKRKSKHRSSQAEFEEVQKSALSLSNQIPSARVLQKRDALRPKFEKIQEEIEDYIEFLHYVEKSNHFLNNRERVIKDAKFTKATVSNILQTQDERRGPSTKELDELELE
jgi:tetratricopeptide (TPR) repeat protein